MKSAREYAAGLLSVRRYTKKELERKLALKGYDREEAKEAISALEEYGFLDDADYALCYVKDAYNIHKKARARIVMELRQKGVGEQDIDKAFEAFHPDERELLISHMQKRFGEGDVLTFKEAEKIKRYYSSRGYKIGHIDSCIKELYTVESRWHSED